MYISVSFDVDRKGVRNENLLGSLSLKVWIEILFQIIRYKNLNKHLLYVFPMENVAKSLIFIQNI